MKKTIFWIIILLGNLLIIDSVTYLALFTLGKKKNIFYEHTNIDQAKIKTWLDESFNPILGWTLPLKNKNNLGTRRNTDYPNKEIYKIKTFGNSFTMGAEVSPEETFQAYIEQKTDWDCLNYGVGGYGTDQAYLTYKHTKIKTKYSILGVLSENIGRVVSVYPAYYMRTWLPPKPRYVKKEDKFQLLELNIKNKQNTDLLFDINYLDKLKNNDYWPHFYKNKINAPPKLKWPALYTVFKHWSFFYGNAKNVLINQYKPSYDDSLKKYKYTHLYKNNTEAFQILKFLIHEFYRLAIERGEIPILIIFADQFSIDLEKKYGKKVYQPLVNHLNSQNYEFIDIGDVFLKEDYQSYFHYYNSHYNSLGNEQVAKELIKLISQLENQI